MKKLILLILIPLFSGGLKAQVKHIYHDTTKTVSDRVEYEPDTIPCYFEELLIKEIQYQDEIIRDTAIYGERWHKGFVVWQAWGPNRTLSSGDFSFDAALTGTTGTTGTTIYTDNSKPYKQDYPFTRGMPGTFLYEDRKTKVTNLILTVI